MNNISRDRWAPDGEVLELGQKNLAFSLRYTQGIWAIGYEVLGLIP